MPVALLRPLPDKIILGNIFLIDCLSQIPSAPLKQLKSCWEKGQFLEFYIQHSVREYQGCSAVFQGCQFCLEPSTEFPLSVGFELRPVVLLTLRPSSHAQLFTGVGNSLKHAYFQTETAV